MRGAAPRLSRKGVGTVMAQSQNTKVDLTIPATMFVGLTTTGNMMVGDKALEYYNERNVEDYIQIPWDQIDHIAASVLFGGRIIPRFAVFTTENGHFAPRGSPSHPRLHRGREDRALGDLLRRAARRRGGPLAPHHTPRRLGLAARDAPPAPCPSRHFRRFHGPPHVRARIQGRMYAPQPGH